MVRIFPSLSKLLFCAVSLWGLVLLAPTGFAEHNGKIQIILLGDSTTEGSIPRKHVPGGPHLEDVVKQLLAAESDLPPCEVINRGQGGDFIRRLLDGGRYAKEIKQQPGVDYIFIRFGLNDQRRRENFETSFPKDYHELISQLRQDHPQAVLIPMTVIPYFDAATDEAINRLVRQVAAEEKLALFDIYPRYSAELKHGPNMLNYRRFPLKGIPEQYRAFVKPFTIPGASPMVEVMDNRLDAHFRNLSGWFADRHPNLAGYHVIGDETAKYLAPLIRAKTGRAKATAGSP